MKKLFCILILALASTLAYAQRPDQIELPCPAGSSPTWWGQSYDQATGKYRQWQCVKQNGTVTQAITDSGIGGQVFNVKAYGAKGDSTTNDSPSFQSAYAAAVAAGGGIVYIPPPTAGSCYLLSTTLNFTGGNLNGHQVVVEEASSGWEFSATSAPICANTGSSPIIDMTGTTGLTLKNLAMSADVAGLSTPSEIGIISGRTSTAASGQGDKIVDCSIFLPTHTSGTTKSYGIYFYGVELSFNARDYILADYPLTVSATNIYSLASALDTWTTGTQSEKGDSFIDMELDSAGLGPAATFDGTRDMKLTGHSYNFSFANPYPAGLYQYALYLAGINGNMFVNWDQEEYPGFAFVHLTLEDSIIMGTDAPGGSPPLHCIEFDDASTQIKNVDFRISDQYTLSSGTNYYYDATANATQGVLVLDHVNFACGGQQYCANIPVGNYQPAGFHAYARNVTYSSDGDIDPATLKAFPWTNPSAGTASLVNGTFTHTFQNAYYGGVNCTATTMTTNPIHFTAISSTAFTVAGTGTDQFEWNCEEGSN